MSRAYGTSVPELAPGDIEQLPIPRLKREIECEIADAAEQASELRRKADNQENNAVAKLEEELGEELGRLGQQMDSRITSRAVAGEAEGI